MTLPQDDAPLRFRFADRAAAERAGELLRSQTGCAPRFGVTEDDYVLTVAEAEPVRREAARSVLEAAGGRMLATDAAHAPRAVQPGFTDAAPGIVPDSTDLAPEKSEDYEDAGGRFARQIERAPETPRKG